MYSQYGNPGSINQAELLAVNHWQRVSGKCANVGWQPISVASAEIPGHTCMVPRVALLDKFPDMVTALKSFRPQLQLYCQQARDAVLQQGGLRSNAGDCRVVMTVQELDEFIAVGISLFDGLARQSESVQEQIVAGSLPFDRGISEAFIAAWQEWLEPCASVEAAIQWCENRNELVRNAARFRQCVQEVKLQSTDIDALIRANENAATGRGVSLDEAMRGLRAHSRP
jgi:hypothetical protein